MQIGRITGATRILGKAQGYMGLPVRDETMNCAVGGEGTPSMVTAWLPTPKELEALNAGASVHVRILGIHHPPIMVDVGEVAEMTKPPSRALFAIVAAVLAVLVLLLIKLSPGLGTLWNDPE